MGLIVLLFVAVICKVLVKQFAWARNIPMLRRLFLDEEDEIVAIGGQRQFNRADEPEVEPSLT